MKSLKDIEQALERDPSAEERAEIQAALRRLKEECRLISIDVELALQRPYDDMRGPLLVFIHDSARVHGRTPAEQVQAFMDDGDERFLALALAAWGISFDG